MPAVSDKVFRKMCEDAAESAQLSVTAITQEPGHFVAPRWQAELDGLNQHIKRSREPGARGMQ